MGARKGIDLYGLDESDDRSGCDEVPSTPCGAADPIEETVVARIAGGLYGLTDKGTWGVVVSSCSGKPVESAAV